MTASVWTETFRVRSYETDRHGRASIATLCNYMQEAAGNHAGELGLAVDQLLQQDLTWVLSRLLVEVSAYPTWRDDVTIETWPSGENGLFATRDFVLSAADGSPLALATSAWLMIDVGRRRPIRIPESVSSIELPERAPALGGTTDRLSEPSSEAAVIELPVRNADLDVNGHVNNVQYIGWAIEAVPRPVLEGSVVSRLEVHFRAEATLGDVVAVRTGRLGGEDRLGDEDRLGGEDRIGGESRIGGEQPKPREASISFAHLVFNAATGRELARVVTTWREQD